MEADAGPPTPRWPVEDLMTSEKPTDPASENPPDPASQADPPTQSWTPNPPPSPPSSPPPPTAPPPSAPPPPPPTSAAPDWRPPPADHGRNASLVFGVIILIVGLWFFATRTLGLDLPDLDWGQLWPLLLIGIGAWIVLGAVGRRR